MRIRRYIARSLQEALERIREELGPEALILETRRRWRWWVPWRPPSVEVVVAWEPPRAGLSTARASGAGTLAVAGGEAPAGVRPRAARTARTAGGAGAGAASAATWPQEPDGWPARPDPEPARPDGPPGRADRLAGRGHGAPVGPEGLGGRGLGPLGEPDGPQDRPDGPDGSEGPGGMGSGRIPARVGGLTAVRVRAEAWPGPASDEAVWFQRLVEQDVEPSLAWSLVSGASVRSRGARTPFDQALLEQLAATVPTRPVWEQDRRLRTVVLVGPTGAGKTTTVAKLAANFALVAGWRVGLVAADTYRIGAIQQLRTYADLIGIPLDVAQDGRELRQILASSDRELVLVDTAGHAPQDAGRLAGIRELCDALPEGSEVLLVVPALLRQEDLAELLQTYRELPVTAICVTKLDETRRRGALVNAPCWTGRPLRFLTTGQAVPDDIETADPQTLARWLLYGSEEGSGASPAEPRPPAGGRWER